MQNSPQLSPEPAGILIDAEIDTVPAPAPTLESPEAESATAVAAPPQAETGSGRLLLLGASLVLIAFNLRPALASLAPVLPEVMRDRGLTPTAMSLLTTLPVLCLGFFAPLAPRLARRWGTERAILILLVVLAAGTALRGLASVPALVAGAVLTGASIGIVNVLLPGLVKRDFPHRAALMTGLYTMALCAGAAGAAGATLPLKTWLGGSWPAALAIWAAPVLLIILIWAPQVPSRRAALGHAGFTVHGLWRDKLAWQITLFMGLQSALAYSVFGWLVPILRDRGLDPVKAGLVVSVSILCQVAASLVAPSLATLGRDQRLCNALAIAVSLVGLMGLLFTPLDWVWGWSVLLGLGQGSLISVALTIIVLRSPDAHVAAHLSSMVQSVGYTLAATGPLLVGPLHSLTGDWRGVGIMFLVLGIAAGWFGLGAGRNRLVGATSHPVA